MIHRWIAIVALGLSLTCCAYERVDGEAWLYAQRDASVIDPTLDYSPHIPIIFHLTQAELCKQVRESPACKTVAGYYIGSRVAMFRIGPRWMSDLYFQSYIVHEATHSLQPDHWSRDCGERHAYAVQSQWLQERGQLDEAIAALSKALSYNCEAY